MKIITTVPVPISVSIIRKMSVVFTFGYISPVLNIFLNIHVRAKNDFSNKDYYHDIFILFFSIFELGKLYQSIEYSTILYSSREYISIVVLFFLCRYIDKYICFAHNKLMSTRWNSKSADARLVRKEFASGRFDPTDFSGKSLREAHEEFSKYKQRNFTVACQKIAKEFTRIGRDGGGGK